MMKFADSPEMINHANVNSLELGLIASKEKLHRDRDSHPASKYIRYIIAKKFTKETDSSSSLLMVLIHIK